MRGFPWIIPCVLTLAVSQLGCLLPVVQRIPKTTFQCRVINRATGQAVPRAEVFLVHEGPGQREYTYGPFLTNQDGSSTVSLPSKYHWMSGPEAFFTVGHTRYIRVSAHGYEPGYRWEDLIRRDFERDSPITITVQPFLNNHGGGVVLEYRPEEDRYFLTLRMVDGPLAGRTESIKVMPSKFLKVSV